MTRAPFQQLAFGDLPAAPRVPHGYFDTDGRDISVDARGFGRMPVHVRVHGSGPPLLLVHGFMTSSYSWRYAFEHFGRVATCYAPDLPGNGRTPGPLDASYSPDALADWIADVQRALGIRGCPVIGNSMGGYLAMKLALRDPGAMSRLVNLHSPGVPEPRLKALRVAMAAPGAKALLRWLVLRNPQRWVHKNVHYYDETLKSLEEAREYGAPLSDRAGVDAFIKYLTETMRHDHMAQFVAELDAVAARGFPVPLLLVYAQSDPMVPPRVGRILASHIPDAQLAWMDQASHFAHVDAADRFAALAMRFLGLPAESGA